MSEKTRIHTDRAPAAIGPYSQAVRGGEMVFTSGQIPFDPDTGALVDGGVREQTEQVMKNLAAVLSAAGTSLDRVVKAGIFLKDMDDFAVVNEVYGKWVESAVLPARSTVQVSRLPKDVMVEIDMIAI